MSIGPVNQLRREGEEDMTKYTGSLKDIPLHKASGPTMEKRIVFSPDVNDWPGHVVRYFTIKAGTGNPLHRHDWPHWGLILKGSATGEVDGETFHMEEGGWFYIPPKVAHRFQAGEEDFHFICMVPEEGDRLPVTMVE